MGDFQTYIFKVLWEGVKKNSYLYTQWEKIYDCNFIRLDLDPDPVFLEGRIRKVGQIRIRLISTWIRISSLYRGNNNVTTEPLTPPPPELSGHRIIIFFSFKSF